MSEIVGGTRMRDSVIRAWRRTRPARSVFLHRRTSRKPAERSSSGNFALFVLRSGLGSKDPLRGSRASSGLGYLIFRSYRAAGVFGVPF